MHILITGVAGFIGSYAAHEFLKLGHSVFGIDNLNDYYETVLKLQRLESLKNSPNFNFRQADIADSDAFTHVENFDEIDCVLHLAAQAGVRYSITNPIAYAHSNLLGHLSVLEMVRNHPKKPLLIYASSSSVYGNDSVAPFKESAEVSKPVSLYAATKIADELMSYTYAHLYKMPQIGLRFFTVYGPWGRPDMAYWGFSDAILRGEPITIFNNGKLRRDFTYIDDIIEGIVRIATNAPKFDNQDAPHKVYNIGNSQPVELMEFIETLENALGKKAVKEYAPMQAGDVFETSADISELAKDYGFAPNTPLKYGLQQFADWFKSWRDLN